MACSLKDCQSGLLAAADDCLIMFKPAFQTAVLCSLLLLLLLTLPRFAVTTCLPLYSLSVCMTCRWLSMGSMSRGMR